MITPTRPRLRAPLALAWLSATAATAAAQASPGCAPNVPCQKVASFVASVTDVRPSVAGNNRLVAITLNVQNATDHVLRLGYVGGSGVATDERGNRYGLLSVRGIGQIANGSFDPKFVLSPGEASIVRFEFAWQPTRGAIYGSTYDVELSLREIDPVTENQFELGREHVLLYKSLAPGAVVADAGASPAPPPAPASPSADPPAAAPEVDPCEGKERCYNGGPFVAEITQLTPSAVGGRHHMLTLQVKIKNLGTEPLILAYRPGSSVAVDELGNRYVYGRPGTHDVSFKGIGAATASSVDARFGLRPGQSGNATFNVIRFNSGRQQIGTSWTFDATLVELIPVNATQAKQGREFAMTFTDLTPAGAKGVKGLLNALTKKKTKP